MNEKLLGLFWAAKERLRAAEFHRAVIKPVMGLGDLKTPKIERRFRSQRLLLTDTTFQSRENIPLKLIMFLILLKVCVLIKDKLGICCDFSTSHERLTQRKSANWRCSSHGGSD